jgi:hypothetical protein
MNFELSQQLRTQADLETIILVLAEQVKKVSTTMDVTNEGVIIATRIEPTIASLLRFDRTVIVVETNEDRVLLIAEVSCRPTALFWVILIVCIPTFVAWLVPIGIYMAQKGAVQSAVAAVFKRVKDELEVMAPPGRRGRSTGRD